MERHTSVPYLILEVTAPSLATDSTILSSVSPSSRGGSGYKFFVFGPYFDHLLKLGLNGFELLISRDQNLSDSSVNVISCFTISVNHEVIE